MAVVEYEIEIETPSEELEVRNGFVVVRSTGEVVGRVYVYY